jgi:hypothetical protein
MISFIVLAIWVVQAAAAAETGPRISITVRSDSGAAIHGAMVETERDGKIVRLETDANGKASIVNLSRGEYKLAVSSDGFEQAVQPLVIQDERQEIEIEFTLISKLRRTDSVDVVADAGPLEVLQQSVPATAELKTSQTEVLPTRPATVTDALPLVPGVSQASSGEIQISGQGEPRSALLVNATNVTDPTTGRFGTTVPIDSVETITVLKSPFLPQYGDFTAGVVSVETKRGGEKWRFSLKEPFPDFRVRSGRLHGLRDATPRLSFNGPLIRNKLYLSEATQYRLEKKQTRTLSFPNNESKDEAVNAFTQFDYIASATHFLTVSFHAAPEHINFVDPQFFNPQPVTPSLRRLESALTLSDHTGAFGGLLDSSLTQQVFDARIGAQGEADMVLSPQGNSGNYFARRKRDSSRIEWLETLSLNKGSAHALKFGITASRVTNKASFSFRPIEIRDPNGQRLERIEFSGGDPFQKSDVEQGFFAQDHWTLRPNLAVDGGVRSEYQVRTSTLRVAPRVGLAWTPFGERRLVLRSGFGVFYQRVPLTVFSFDRYPEQVITTYDASGAITDSRRYLNVLEEDSNTYPLVKRGSGPGNFAPRSNTWTIEAERSLGKFIHLRANYQHTHSTDEVLLTSELRDGVDVHAIGGGGQSSYRQLELTARVSWKDGQQMMFSYVRSKAEGDLNTFGTYLNDFPGMPIRPNRFSNLRGDIPNRFIAWGIINMPWKARLAPIFEHRSGLPYAILEERLNYVGIPFTDKTRFRSYTALDERMSRDFRVTSKYKVRISASVLNVLNHFNPLDVHANVADPLFGTFFGHYKRRYRADFELLF